MGGGGWKEEVTLLMIVTIRPHQMKQPPSQTLLVILPERAFRGVLPLQLNTLAQEVTPIISADNSLARATP